VHIALKGLLGYQPDMVVSGINNGANMGDDTIYSGTVGAAMEGYLFGIPAIAFSQVKKGWEHIDAAALKARDIVAELIKQLETTDPLTQPWLLNANIPNLPYDQLKATQICRLGKRHASEKVITQTSPHGRTMYWIAGSGPAKDGSEGTDFYATANGHVALTPLTTDLTEHAAITAWARTLATFA
jgi:5'-nucleotidase